jgi:hypothetical protein
MIALIAILGAIAVAVIVFSREAPSPRAPRDWIVAPNGSESNTGEDAANATTVQAALGEARPGDVIRLQPGVYTLTAPLQTKRSGTAEAPITVMGPENGLDIRGRNKAIITGVGDLIDVDHSYYVFSGFTLNGQPKLAFDEIPDTPRELIEFKDRNQSRILGGQLIYIGYTAHSVRGITIDNMFLTGAGNECIRIRNLTTDSTVTNSRILRCGMKAKDKDYPYHNGEGVYIGTSPASGDQPYHDNDRSDGNLVRHNVIETFGSECVNIKENASRNIIDSNQCRYGLGPDSADESIVEVRGKENQITNNVIEHSYGYGVKLWSDQSSYGGKNIIARNHFGDINSYTITVKKQPQPEEVCENTYVGGTPEFEGLTETDMGRPCSQPADHGW